MKARSATFERILDNAPATFSATQLRVFLRALVNLDPYTFTDDVAEHFAGDDENHHKSAEEILLGVVDSLSDDKLTGFALRLVLTGSTPIPRNGEADSLTDAAAAFLPAKPKKKATKQQTRRRLSKPPRRSPPPRSRSQPNPRAGPDHRLRVLSYKEECRVSVQLQTQSCRTSKGEMRTPSTLQPRARRARRHQGRMLDLLLAL